jgi:PHD/YefM family antitoxin component YafN of YafNO toxin-antitoxin module
MKKTARGEFKARCLTLMDELRSARKPLLIMKRGKLVAKLVPQTIRPEDSSAG